MAPEHDEPEIHGELEIEEITAEEATTAHEKRAGEQDDLQRAIEAAFAKADRANLRDVTREIERLLKRLDDKALRARYESAVDLLPDMVKHAGTDD